MFFLILQHVFVLILHHVRCVMFVCVLFQRGADGSSQAADGNRRTHAAERRAAHVAAPVCQLQGEHRHERAPRGPLASATT